MVIARVDDSVVFVRANERHGSASPWVCPNPVVVDDALAGMQGGSSPSGGAA